MAFWLNFFGKIRAERFFLVMAGLFGALYLFVTPPFQVPDEPNHFYRAWQVAEGGFISVKEDNRVGGNLPLSLDKITQPFLGLIWKPDGKMKDVHIEEVFKIPLNKTETKFYDFNNTALYSPLCYLPAAVGIFILRLADAPPLYAFYAARLCLLVFWLFIVYLALRITPVYKWLFCVLALLPMSLFINMSISADVVTNAFCFLFVAYVLRCAKGEGSITKRKLVYLCGLIFFIASVKSVYTPLILLVLIIPKDKFGSRKDYAIRLGLLFFTCILISFLWSSLLNPLYISYGNYNPGFRDGAALVNGADMQEQIRFLSEHRLHVFKVLGNSVIAAFEMYAKGYIGTFGWLNIHLPAWFIYLGYILILFIAVVDGDRTVRFSLFTRLVFACCFLALTALVFLSQLLIWVPVGGDLILNIQGRYLIPCLPLFFMLFYTRYDLKGLAAGLVCILGTAGLCFSWWVLYSHYF